MLVHDVNGLYVEPGDKAQMIETVLDVLGEPEKYQHLGENAREQMVRDYSFEVCLPRLASYYFEGVDELGYQAVAQEAVAL